MPIEIKRGENIESKEIYGNSFRIPSIFRQVENYQLKNLSLPIDWQESSKNIDLNTYCQNFDRIHESKINGQVLYDSKTNLITEISFDIGQSSPSRVSLDTYEFSSTVDSYNVKNLKNLHTAIIYQEFLSRYLSYLNNYKNQYPYIFCSNNGLTNNYGSVDLDIPEDVYEKLSHPVTNEYYQEHAFPLIASHICGQFSTRFQYLDFDEEGFLRSINIDSDACSYDLSEFFGRKHYSPHNVDNKYQAATHHGIVAEFINYLIERKEDQED